VKPPEPLTPNHEIADFNCGNAVLNDWLRERAIKNQAEGATRTFVVCEGMRVTGYYALALGQANRGDAPSNLSRGMPDPIPMMVLARLAIDSRSQGLGLGRDLVRDAIERTLRVSLDAGVRGVLVSAIDANARQFYEKLGFIPSKADENVLMLRLKTAIDVLR
jgi:GNAT superfamily N-acetyltransferase